MKYVLERTGLQQLPTATTRPIRPGEQEGREHLYVSRETFQHMIESDQLLEHQVIHGNLYGMPRSAV
ncbi:MAG: guanylate kinase, partial [Chloroflexota bacterium]